MSAPRTRILLIDGRSGSGKTTVARQLADRLGAALVHMDDLYPGWRGLADGSRYATERVLAPLRRGEPAVWRRWDWPAGLRAEEHRLSPGGTLILEGCGSLSRLNRGLADSALWIELPETVRRERARSRDGDDWWWQQWREQEDAFYAEEGSRALADAVWHGAGTLAWP